MALPLTVYAFGTFLGKRSERLVVREGKRDALEVPLFRVSEIVIPQAGVTISSDLVREACARGIRILFLSQGGRPYAVLSSPLIHATVSVRRAQMEAMGDLRGVLFCQAVVRAKLRNQSRLLLYFGRRLQETDAERFSGIVRLAGMIDQAAREAEEITCTDIAKVRGALMGIEGSAGRVYWQGVSEILRDRVEFPGRTGRGAIDGVNALLNYGYGILSGTIWGAVLNAGLDPYAGFLHTDRPGKPSLVLDLEEEFRQPVVDRAIIAALDRGFSIRLVEGRLAPETRREIAARVVERLDAVEPGQERLGRSIVQSQARRLAAFLCGRAKRYRAASFKW